MPLPLHLAGVGEICVMRPGLARGIDSGRAIETGYAGP